MRLSPWRRDARGMKPPLWHGSADGVGHLDAGTLFPRYPRPRYGWRAEVARALMEDDQKQRPDSLLPYEKWIEQALRHVVAQAIEHVAVEGLPGGHHFYITFRTGHPGVELPQRMRRNTRRK